MNPRLDAINQSSPLLVRQDLLQCCGSRRWVELMLQARPFENETDLYETATLLWKALGPMDWLEAFSHHPRIGAVIPPDTKATSEKKSEIKIDKNSQWAQKEQSGVKNATPEILARLAEQNEAYFKKFGFIYLVCATGKLAAEMLDLLDQRMENTRDQEIKIAAAEQDKITRLRLEKLLKT